MLQGLGRRLLPPERLAGTPGTPPSGGDAAPSTGRSRVEALRALPASLTCHRPPQASKPQPQGLWPSVQRRETLQDQRGTETERQSLAQLKNSFPPLSSRLFHIWSRFAGHSFTGEDGGGGAGWNCPGTLSIPAARCVAGFLGTSSQKGASTRSRPCWGSHSALRGCPPPPPNPLKWERAVQGWSVCGVSGLPSLHPNLRSLPKGLTPSAPQ